MALRKIVLQGEPCLTKVCRPVTEFNGRLHTLLDDLKDTLLDSGGVGLAAPQVGILRRVCVVMNEDDEIIELVNPEIIATDGEQTGLEGCLSVPGKFGVVTRPYTVRVRAQDRDGAFFEVEDEALTARCFCHEIEHLDGHLFVERTDHLLTEEELDEYIRQQEEGRRGVRILFMGTPDFAVASLKRLVEDGHEVVGVFTQPDRPKNRGHKLAFSPVKEYALAQGITVYQPTKMRDGTALALVRELASGADRGGGLWPHPAGGHSEHPTLRLHQRSFVPAAQIPGGGSHQLGHPQRGAGDRRHHHVHGQGAGRRGHSACAENRY